MGKAQAKAAREGRAIRQAELNASLGKPLTSAEKKRRDLEVNAALIEFQTVYPSTSAPMAGKGFGGGGIVAPKVWVQGSADHDLLQEDLAPRGSGDQGGAPEYKLSMA